MNDTKRSRYAWYVVAVLTLANVCAFVDRQVLSLLVVPIKRDLGVTDTQMSYLIGLSFSLFYTVLGLPIGRWADRGNRRTIIAGGITLWSVMTTLGGVAHSYGRLLLARVGVGVGEATLNAPAVSLVSDYFTSERRGSAMSVYSLGVFLGSGLGYFIGGWAVDLAASADQRVWPIVGVIRPWQAVFFLVGPPGLLVALLMLTVRDPRSSLGGKAQPAAIATLLRYVSANRRAFAAHALGFALYASVNFGIAAWLATFFVRTYAWTAVRAGMVQGVLTMTVGVAGVLVGGRVTDHFVRRGRTDAALRVGIIGALGMLVSASAYPFMPTATLAVTLLAVVNLFAAFPWGAAAAGAAEMVPTAIRAQGVALYFFVLTLVSAVGPSAVAFITDYVLRDEARVGYSLAIVNALGMSGAIVLFVVGLPAFRRTLESRSRWTVTGAVTGGELRPQR